nr:MAG TPA: hypothetical protein [Caudoviricetes sp.]
MWAEGEGRVVHLDGPVILCFQVWIWRQCEN